MEQLNIFDTIQITCDIPKPNAQGMIPAEQLIPIRWKHWRYSNDNWTLGDGTSPYIIEACLVKLPGNRLYAKEWMKYPFMYEFASSEKLERAYAAAQKRIEERMERNNDTQRAWEVNYPPRLEDMWRYKDGEYSCREYAEKVLFGYAALQGNV